MKIIAIALNTTREAIRNKVLYSILFFAFLVVAISALFGSVSLGDQMKFVKDFSLMSISLFSVVIAVVMGVNMLNKELGKKTIFNILSKPVTRTEFILGKFLGLLTTLALIVVVMCGSLLLFLALLEGRLDWGVVLASVATLMEVTIVVGAAVFFSSIVVTPTLAGLFTAATFIAGRSVGYLAYFDRPEFSPLIKAIAHALSWILPNLGAFYIANQVVYGDSIAPELFLYLAAEAVGRTGILLLLSIAIFSRREFT